MDATITNNDPTQAQPTSNLGAVAGGIPLAADAAANTVSPAPTPTTAQPAAPPAQGGSRLASIHQRGC